MTTTIRSIFFFFFFIFMVAATFTMATPPPHHTPSFPTPVPSPSTAPTPVMSSSRTPTPVLSPSRTHTPVPSLSRTPTYFPSPSRTPTPVPSSSRTPTPVPSPSKTSTPVPSLSRTPVTYVVGDELGWTVGGLIVYPAWVSNKEFFVGDTLVFDFANGAHDVAELTSKEDYESCTMSRAWNRMTSSPARIILSTPGEHFFVTTFPMHCRFGMKLAINVFSKTSESNEANPPSTAASGGFVVRPSPASTHSNANVVVASITLLFIAFTTFYFH